MEITKKDFSQKSNPLISIIVTSYNYEDYIGRNLDSLISQTYDNYEILVVDDGSSDNSVNIIKEYAAKNNKIKYLEHEGHANKGLENSIKLALEHAKGEYTAFCESDDYWAVNHLEKKVECIRKFKDADIIINPPCMFGDEKNIAEYKRGFYTLFYKLRQLKKPENMYLRMLSTHSFPNFSCVMVRTSALRACNLDTPVRNGVDIWLWRQLTLRYKTMLVDEEISYWYLHKSHAGDQIYEFFKKKNFTERDYYQQLQCVLNLPFWYKVLHKIHPFFNKYIWHIRVKNDYLVKRLFKIKVYKKKIDFGD